MAEKLLGTLLVRCAVAIRYDALHQNRDEAEAVLPMDARQRQLSLDRKLATMRIITQSQRDVRINGAENMIGDYDA